MRAVKWLRHGLAVSGLLAAFLVVPVASSAGVASGCVTHPESMPGGAGFQDADTVSPGAAADLAAPAAPRSARAAFTVPVVWNVFYDQNNPVDGAVSDGAIAQTMKVVNASFNQAGLYFAVASVRRFPATYHVVHGVAIGNAVEAQIKSVRQGDVQTLNIYTVARNPSHDLAGWSSFPWDYQANPQNDGIVYDHNYLPGGLRVGYNTGKVMTHEIGHWVGLLHTFQDGCHGGDLVNDTPPEASPGHICPVGRDTCAAPGTDPIHNMMDYTDDACRTHFTTGQFARMAGILHQYRGITLS